MNNLEEGYLESFINLRGLLSQKVNYQSQSDFLTFVRLMAPSLVSNFEMGNHIKVISNKLKELEEGTIKRLMVFLPPRSSKSVICSKLFPARFSNTCWSLVATNDGIKVGASYKATEEKIAKVSAFVSKTGEDAALSKKTYEESIGWYNGITADMFG